MMENIARIANMIPGILNASLMLHLAQKVATLTIVLQLGQNEGRTINLMTLYDFSKLLLSDTTKMDCAPVIG